METSLPIYGLACPSLKTTTQEFDTATKKCGCMDKKVIHGIVKNGVTKKPFDAGLVNVYNTVTSKGTTPDKNGKFSLKASPNDLIHISFIGFKTIQIEASKLPAMLELQEHNEMLPEVIITAGKKKDHSHLYAGLGVLGLLFMYAIAKDKNKKKQKI